MKAEMISKELSGWIKDVHEENSKTPTLEGERQSVIVVERTLDKSDINKNLVFTGRGKTGLVPFVSTGKGFERKEGSEVRASDYATGAICKKYPKSLKVVWIRDGPIEDVRIKNINFRINDHTLGYADFYIAFDISIQSSNDVMNLLGLVEEKQQAHPNPDGGEYYIVYNIDLLTSVAEILADSFKYVTLDFNSIIENRKKITEILLKELNGNEMITRRGIYPKCVFISYSTTTKEHLANLRSDAESCQMFDELDFGVKLSDKMNEIEYNKRLKELEEKSRNN